MEGAFGRLPALGLLLAALAGCDAAPAEDCRAPAAAAPLAVRAAIDGDTVRLADGRALRLIGLNALETGKDGAPDQPFAAAATRRLDALLRQGPVRAVAGVEPVDRHGRALADLYAADGKLIAATLAAEGLGLAVVVPPNDARLGCVLDAEREARRTGRGLWADAAAWTVPARSADPGLRGFARVEGVVSARRERDAGTSVELDGRVELWFPAGAAARTASVAARAVPGARLAARGWWGAYRGRPSLRIEHPAQLEIE